MSTSKVISGAGWAILLAACSAASTDNSGGANEANAVRTSAAASAPPSPSPAPLPAAQAPVARKQDDQFVRVPEDVLRDAKQLMPLMQEVRRQIIYRTKEMPNSTYEQLVRPSIARDLRAAGFSDADVDQILADVDYSRTIQGFR